MQAIAQSSFDLHSALADLFVDLTLRMLRPEQQVINLGRTSKAPVS